MAYRLKLDEDVMAGVRRIGREEIDKTLERLTQGDNPMGTVHETRKSVKRLRALLQLVRPGLGGADFQRMNARLRDIARLFAETRETDVFGETVTLLETKNTTRSEARALAALRLSLNETLPHMGPETPPEEKLPPKIVERAKRELDKTRCALKKLRTTPDDIDIVGAGLARTYRAGREAFVAARASRDGDLFHEWRKTVQQHWRHMILLAEAWPSYMAARQAEARKLSQILGSDHDLVMLVGAAIVHLKPKEAAAIWDLCAREVMDLRKQAVFHGERLFAERPKQLRRRIMFFWGDACHRVAQDDILSEVVPVDIPPELRKFLP